MFCLIKYIDYADYQKEEQDVQEEQTEAAPAPSIENKILLINPDCPIGILRDYISSKLQLQDDQAESFELCTEKATLLDSRNAPPTQQGIDILKNNEIYYVVLLPTERSREHPKLLAPLLGHFTSEYLEFMAQQFRKSSSSKLRKKSSLRVSSTMNGLDSSSRNSKKSTG